MNFFQHSDFGDSVIYFGGKGLLKYIMGLGHGSRGVPSYWIQLSLLIVNIQSDLGYEAKWFDPITSILIHTVGTLLVDNTDLYT